MGMGGMGMNMGMSMGMGMPDAPIAASSSSSSMSPFSYPRRCSADQQRASGRSIVSASGSGTGAATAVTMATGAKPKKNFWTMKPWCYKKALRHLCKKWSIVMVSKGFILTQNWTRSPDPRRRSYARCAARRNSRHFFYLHRYELSHFIYFILYNWMHMIYMLIYRLRTISSQLGMLV